MTARPSRTPRPSHDEILESMVRGRQVPTEVQEPEIEPKPKQSSPPPPPTDQAKPPSSGKAECVARVPLNLIDKSQKKLLEKALETCGPAFQQIDLLIQCFQDVRNLKEKVYSVEHLCDVLLQMAEDALDFANNMRQHAESVRSVGRRFTCALSINHENRGVRTRLVSVTQAQRTHRKKRKAAKKSTAVPSRKRQKTTSGPPTPSAPPSPTTPSTPSTPSTPVQYMVEDDGDEGSMEF